MNQYALTAILSLEKAKAEIIKHEAHAIAEKSKISIQEAFDLIEKEIAMAKMIGDAPFNS